MGVVAGGGRAVGGESEVRVGVVGRTGEFVCWVLGGMN